MLFFGLQLPDIIVNKRSAEAFVDFNFTLLFIHMEVTSLIMHVKLATKSKNYWGEGYSPVRRPHYAAYDDCAWHFISNHIIIGQKSLCK